MDYSNTTKHNNHMLPRIQPQKTESWARLSSHADAMKELSMRLLFEQDKQRFDKFHVLLNGMLFDYSKHRITDATIRHLLELAGECGLPQAIHALFNGEAINETEGRAVMHMALRHPEEGEMNVDGKNVLPEVHAVLKRMEGFCEKVRSGELTGHSGKKFTDVVNIGIGGSDLGPVMACEALKPYGKEGPRVHFVSNVDGTHISECLASLDPETTMFIIASKTFTTQETMTNAHSARSWFIENANEEAIGKHFIAVSTAIDKAVEFGISEQHIFGFWSWVGGRYSMWSAIGISIMLSIGPKRFRELLAGAHAADQHFFNTPYERNIPVLMALLGVWYNNFWGAASHAVLPYDQYLHRFPAYLQQADMESNGKYVDRSGKQVNYPTGPIVWGEPGTNGQHAFYQLIHQGTQMIPCDFIAPVQSANPIGRHHSILLSHCFAQSEALMNGKTPEEVRQELEGKGLAEDEIQRLLPYKVFKGNIPSSTFLLPVVDPFQLGQLIALYEHKIFCQGVIWNIFSYDQWGVELGKQLASKILPELEGSSEVKGHDSSTEGLIRAVRLRTGH